MNQIMFLGNSILIAAAFLSATFLCSETRPVDFCACAIFCDTVFRSGRVMSLLTPRIHVFFSTCIDRKT